MARLGVYPDLRGSGAGASWSEAGHADRLQHGLELRGVSSLSGGEEQGQDLLSLLTRQVDLGGEAASGTSQRMIGGLVGDATGRFLLRARSCAGVLMGSGDRGIYADLPR